MNLTWTLSKLVWIVHCGVTSIAISGKMIKIGVDGKESVGL